MNNIREDIEKLIARHNVYIVEQPDYMLNNNQLLDELETYINENYTPKVVQEKTNTSETSESSIRKDIEKILEILTLHNSNNAIADVALGYSYEHRLGIPEATDAIESLINKVREETLNEFKTDVLFGNRGLG